MTEGSVVRARAGSAWRSLRKRPTSSPAKCCASAAEPPLPKTSTLPPARSRALIARPTVTSREAFCSKKRCLSARLSAAMSRTLSSSIVRADVDGQQDREHCRVVDGDLEDRSLADAGGDAQRDREAPLDRSLPVAAAAIED